MKVTKILIAMLASAFIVTACDPIEDEDLRDKYVTDAGTPITKEALQAAISITQPFPNQVNKVRLWSRTTLRSSWSPMRTIPSTIWAFPPIRLSRQIRL